MSRRHFLAATAAVAASPGILAAASTQDTAVRVERITRQTLWNGRTSDGPVRAWFHPRACMIPTSDGAKAVMTLQSISGSDVFGPVHWTTSADRGRTWSEFRPIAGLARKTIGPEYEEGVCDVVPEYHAPTGTVLAMGHNVYYRRGVLARPQGRRFPVYTVFDDAGRWSTPQRLVWDDPRATRIYTCGCSQRVVLPDGNVLVPLSFGDARRADRSVTSALCSFDGRRLAIDRVGNQLDLAVKRGLLEPSLTAFDGRFFMTIRAEDDRGYVSVSDDGLTWQPQRAWAWDDGTPLTMSTTQQHWLVHSDALFLVYTRRDAANANVFRWRAPLYVARVDPETLRLQRDTEQIALPLIGDGVNDAQHVARMGNFHVTTASPHESWITVGETLPQDAWRGDLLLARVAWSRPNRLAQS